MGKRRRGGVKIGWGMGMRKATEVGMGVALRTQKIDDATIANE